MAGARGAWCQVGFWTAQTGFAALAGTKLVRGGAQNAPGRAVRSGADWGQVQIGTLSGDVNAPGKMPGVQEAPLVPGNAGNAGSAGSAVRAGNAGNAGKDQIQRIGASHRER